MKTKILILFIVFNWQNTLKCQDGSLLDNAKLFNEDETDKISKTLKKLKKGTNINLLIYTCDSILKKNEEQQSIFDSLFKQNYYKDESALNSFIVIPRKLGANFYSKSSKKLSSVLTNEEDATIIASSLHTYIKKNEHFKAVTLYTAKLYSLMQQFKNLQKEHITDLP